MFCHLSFCFLCAQLSSLLSLHHQSFKELKYYSAKMTLLTCEIFLYTIRHEQHVWCPLNVLTQSLTVRCERVVGRPHTGSERSLALKALMQACPCLVVSCHTDKPYLIPPEGLNTRISYCEFLWEKSALLLRIWFVCHDKCMQHYKHAYHALRVIVFFVFAIELCVLISWLYPFSCSHGDDLIVTPFAQVSDPGSGSWWSLGYISSSE